MSTATKLLVWVIAQTSITPDPTAIPGGPQVQQLINGLANLVLQGSLAGGLLGAVVWAMGAHSSNPVYVAIGKRALLAAVLAAAVVGMLAALVNFAFDLGGQVEVDTPVTTTP